MQIADLTSLGDVKKIKINVSSTDSQGGSYSFNQTEDYTQGKSMVIANLPGRTYTVTLEVLDGSGKVLATGVASNVQIKVGEATNLSISLSPVGSGGTLVIDVKPPTTSPSAGTLKTIQTLVGTMWSQPGALGGFTILERAITGSDGCNGFGHGPNEYFIFAPGGTILSTADWMGNDKACPPLKTLSSFPWDGWKTYELRDGQLIIKTATGETHTFTHPDPIP